MRFAKVFYESPDAEYDDADGYYGNSPVKKSLAVTVGLKHKNHHLHKV